MAMTRAQFRKQLQDGLNTVFGMEYKRYPEQWRELYTVEKSEKAFEEDQLLVGLGGAVLKPEGSAITYDEGGESWTARYNHDTIGLAFALTEEAMEDNLYGDIGAKYAKSLARSLQFTKEVNGAEPLNDGFSSYLTGDGVSVFDASHPLWGGGVFSNTMSAADLAEASLEDATIQIGEYVDDRGIPIMCQVKKLVVPRAEIYNAQRILTATKRVETADNDPNAMKDMNVIRDGFCVNDYLSDADSWFLTTDCPDGAKHFQRRPVKRGIEGDFETGNMRYKATERYSNGVTNPRGWFGVPGA
jgi:hypothetical protein